MEPKKNSKYDVHRHRGVLLNVGFIVSLLLVITAFRWATPISIARVDLTPHDDAGDFLMVDYPKSTSFKNLEEPKPNRVQSALPVALLKDVSIASPETPETFTDMGEPNSNFNFGSLEIPIENPEPDTFRIVEKMPEPVGGWETFYKTLKKHMKYPRQAERIGTMGKVFVEFTVNNRGQLSNLRILKGIGNGCDEEATRVLALTKWNAGKQRGRPVNVRLVQPIVFSLNRE